VSVGTVCFGIFSVLNAQCGVILLFISDVMFLFMKFDNFHLSSFYVYHQCSEGILFSVVSVTLSLSVCLFVESSQVVVCLDVCLSMHTCNS